MKQLLELEELPSQDVQAEALEVMAVHQTYLACELSQPLALALEVTAVHKTHLECKLSQSLVSALVV